MTVPLGEMLERVLAGEPALGDEVDAVFRRADALRRRRTRLLLAAGLVIAGLIVLAGYLLTSTMMPGRGESPSTSPTRIAMAVPATIAAAATAVPGTAGGVSQRRLGLAGVAGGVLQRRLGLAGVAGGVLQRRPGLAGVAGGVSQRRPNLVGVKLRPGGG